MKKAVTLGEALCCGQNAPAVISLIGGGGKTTAMFLLADEFKALGKKVLVTTTTNIFVPEPWQCDEFLLEGCADVNALAARPGGSITCLGNGLIEGAIRKVKSIDPAFIDALNRAGHFDCMLVEADGAKRKAIKAPADYEPVIPLSTTMVLGVIGLDCLGKPVSEETVHRCELFCACTGRKPGDMIDRESIVRLIMAENGLFKGAPAASRKVVLLNKADTAELQTQAELLARELATQQTNLGCISASLQQGNYMVLLGQV
ncbi:MAG: putative selenium-dependent hydroxylase accessory protein YqeC [Deltaproteobacteria bacterium]|nr:putative selenium-dependent hydroxylase accessory protein YqeC [Deltaproteobacteria bacterium]